MGRALSIIGVPTSAANFTAALEGLTSLNEQLMRDAPQAPPPLYGSGAVYTKEGGGKWRTFADVLNGKGGPAGAGDCEALAPWRAAELRHTGEDPGASVMAYRTGKTKFHAVVLRGDGQLEDPSVVLGMKPPAGLVDTYADWNNAITTSRMADPDGGAGDVAVLGADDDVACIGIGPDVEEGIDAITFDTLTHPHGGKHGGYKGHARIPIGDGRALYAMTSSARTPAEAEQKATAVIGFVGSIWDDVQALVSPFPQAAAALRIARNTHVQNIAKAAYNAVRGRKSGGGGGRPGGTTAAGPGFRQLPVQSPLAAPPGMPTDPGWMPPMGAPTGADLSDPSYYDDMAAGGSDGSGYDDGGGSYRNDDTYQQLMAAKEADDLASGIYGFGPTPSEQACMDHVNGYLASGSRPSIGATFVQRGGANFRTASGPNAGRNMYNPSQSGLPAVNPGTGWLSSSALQPYATTSTTPGSGWQPASPGYVPPPAPAGYSSASPFSGLSTLSLFRRGVTPGYYPGTNTPYSPYSPYSPYYTPTGLGTAYSGGGVSSTGVRYGYGSTSPGSSAPSGGGGGSDYYGGASATDPDAFFGSNPSGLSQEEKAEMLDAYGAGD